MVAMCQMLALSVNGIAIAAVDTRWTWTTVNGLEVDAWYDDFGTKLRRLDRGWAVATGSARWGALGLRALEERGIGHAQQALQAALEEAGAQCTVDALSKFFVVHDDGSMQVIGNHPGETHDVPVPPPGRLSARISWAPGLPQDGGDVQRALAERLGKANDVGSIVHAVAHAFVEAREIGDSEGMSAELEIGLSTRANGFHGYLRAPAVDIHPHCDPGFGPPPVSPPFPELPAERVLFTPYSMAG